LRTLDNPPQNRITLDPEEALIKLQEAGISVESVSEKLIDIANANSTSPMALSEIIMTAAKPDGDSDYPATESPDTNQS